MNKNKRRSLGIVGGMGSHACAYVFDRLVELTPAKTDQEYIETFIHNNSFVPDRTEAILYDGENPLRELRRSIHIMNTLGVDYLMFACVTAHYFLPQIKEKIKANVLDAIELTAEAIANDKKQISTVGVLATTGTIRSKIFQTYLKKRNIDVVVLDQESQETKFMAAVYSEDGIKSGNKTGKPRELMISGAKQLIENGAQAIIAGCTEVPLVLKKQDIQVPLFDPIDIMIINAIRKCF